MLVQNGEVIKVYLTVSLCVCVGGGYLICIHHGGLGYTVKLGSLPEYLSRFGAIGPA